MEEPYHVEEMPSQPSQEPTYRTWNTPSGFAPIHVRLGPQPWQTAVKVGDEWLSGVKSLRINLDSHTYPSVTLELFGEISVERVDR